MKKPLALSTICISAGLALSAQAQSVPEGCYVRYYSAEHLAANPAQIVDWITIYFVRDPDIAGGTRALLFVRMANQGHAALSGAGGVVMRQNVSNFYSPLQFHLDGDGGMFEVVATDADGITLSTLGLFLSPSGDFFDEPQSSLSEQEGIPTRYRLNAADPSACG